MSVNPSTESVFVCVLLAAGVGKRMRTDIPKVLHRLGGVPSIVRVFHSAEQVFSETNPCIVCSPGNVDEMRSTFEAWFRSARPFFFIQPEPKGTADAVRVAFQNLPESFQGYVVVLPGDVGLLDARTLQRLRAECLKKKPDVLLLTGEFLGSADENPYGRVLRARSARGRRTNVLGVVQMQDIVAMGKGEVLTKKVLGREHRFTKKALLNISEFDGLVGAFRASVLRRHLPLVRPDNAQKELYLTDCVASVAEEGGFVEALRVGDSEVLMGFNDRKTLDEMERILERRG